MRRKQQVQCQRAALRALVDAILSGNKTIETPTYRRGRRTKHYRKVVDGRAQLVTPRILH